MLCYFGFSWANKVTGSGGNRYIWRIQGRYRPALSVKRLRCQLWALKGEPDKLPLYLVMQQISLQLDPVNVATSKTEPNNTLVVVFSTY